MGIKLPTREEIHVKIENEGVSSLSPLEEFVYDEEPDYGRERDCWRERLEKTINFCINHALKRKEYEVLPPPAGFQR